MINLWTKRNVNFIFNKHNRWEKNKILLRQNFQDRFGALDCKQPKPFLLFYPAIRRVKKN